MSRCVDFDNLQRARLRDDQYVPRSADIEREAKLKPKRATGKRRSDSESSDGDIVQITDECDSGELLQANNDVTDDEVVAGEDDSARQHSIDNVALVDGRGGHRRHKRKPPPSKRRVVYEQDEAVITCGSLVGAFICGACIAASVGMAFTYSRGIIQMSLFTETSPSSPYTISPNEFRASITRLADNFLSQSAWSWKAFSGRGAQHLSDDSPTQPAVFLLASYPSGYSTMACLARSLAGAFSKRADITIDSSHIANTSSGSGDQAKEVLNTALQKTLASQEYPSAPLPSPPVLLVERLELLPPPSPFLFLSYCDTSDSINPRAVYIFTLHLPASRQQQVIGDRTNEESAIIDYLADDVWKEDRHKDYDPGSVEALITRVSDVTILVQPESNDVLSLVCPVLAQD